MSEHVPGQDPAGEQARVDQGRCVGAGMCLTVAPGLFDLTDDGRAVLTRAPASGDDLAAVRDAAACCPAEAILVRATAQDRP